MNLISKYLALFHGGKRTSRERSERVAFKTILMAESEMEVLFFTIGIANGRTKLSTDQKDS